MSNCPECSRARGRQDFCEACGWGLSESPRSGGVWTAAELARTRTDALLRSFAAEHAERWNDAAWAGALEQAEALCGGFGPDSALPLDEPGAVLRGWVERWRSRLLPAGAAAGAARPLRQRVQLLHERAQCLAREIRIEREAIGSDAGACIAQIRALEARTDAACMRACAASTGPPPLAAPHAALPEFLGGLPAAATECVESLERSCDALADRAAGDSARVQQAQKDLAARVDQCTAVLKERWNETWKPAAAPAAATARPAETFEQAIAQGDASLKGIEADIGALKFAHLVKPSEAARTWAWVRFFLLFAAGNLLGYYLLHPPAPDIAPEADPRAWGAGLAGLGLVIYLGEPGRRSARRLAAIEQRLGAAGAAIARAQAHAAAAHSAALAEIARQAAGARALLAHWRSDGAQRAAAEEALRQRLAPRIAAWHGALAKLGPALHHAPETAAWDAAYWTRWQPRGLPPRELRVGSIYCEDPAGVLEGEPRESIALPVLAPWAPGESILFNTGHAAETDESDSLDERLAGQLAELRRRLDGGAGQDAEGPGSAAAANEAAAATALRLVLSLPPGRARLSAIAPAGRPAWLEPLTAIAAGLHETPEAIEAALAEACGHIDRLHKLGVGSKAGPIETYNLAQDHAPEPYRLVLYLGFPQHCTAKAIAALARIVREGTACGVHAIVAWDAALPMESALWSKRDALAKALCIDAAADGAGRCGALAAHPFALEPMPAPAAARLAARRWIEACTG